MRGIVTYAVLPLRAEPNHRSEMVSQLLFGETYIIIDKTKNWIHIECDFDHYRGWIELSSHTDFTAPATDTTAQSRFVTHRLFTPVNDSLSGEIIHIPAGSSVPGFNNNKIEIGNVVYRFPYAPYELKSAGNPENVVKQAMHFLNTPYLWGGRNPYGMDCSGFVQISFKMIGIDLPRDASQQINTGKIVDFVDEAKPGNLAFFDNKEGEIIHVGIILSNNHIIHCSGKVRIDMLDHFGIFNRETKTYSHSLRIIKTLG